MKSNRWLALLGAFVMISGFLGVFCGCEDTPTINDLDSFFAANPQFPDPRLPGNKPLDIRTDPSPPTVAYAGEKIAMLALGGPSSYSWAVIDTSIGTLAVSEQSDSALYTAVVPVENTVYVTDSRGRSAIVEIGTSNGSLSISPSSKSIPTNYVGRTLAFQAVNGVPPFTWSVSDASLGTVTAPAPGGTASYTVSTNGFSGDNTLTVVDKRGTIASATIKHE